MAKVKRTLVKRTLWKEYETKGTELPSKLAFLKGVRFHAVARHTLDDGRRKTRIEFQVKPLREFVELVNRVKEIQKKNTSLVAKVKALESRLEDQEIENVNLNTVNEQLRANLDECEGNMKGEQRSRMKGSFQAAEERAFKPTSSKPYPGGSPGLGKKR